mmetsp:Transcript_3976/g.7400  ORF Transcript_3976/g.7400 Transcript_3976/m.7400 type:complete len:92 (+) Transcript_3976:799-1074(+)
MGGDLPKLLSEASTRKRKPFSTDPSAEKEVTRWMSMKEVGREAWAAGVEDASSAAAAASWTALMVMLWSGQCTDEVDNEGDKVDGMNGMME